MSQTPPETANTVLIVDDRKDVAETMAELCRAFGRTAAVGADGIGMLALLEQHHPACVIVDVMMPDQDGYEALKDIARFNPAMPVLLVTGHGDDWLRIGRTLGKAQGLTTVHTAAKPVRAPALRAFLDEVLAQ